MRRLSALASLLFAPITLFIALQVTVAPATDDASRCILTVVRGAVVALASWATAATAVGAAARLLHLRRTMRLSDVLTAPPLRRALDVVVSAAIVTSSIAPATAAVAQSAPPILQRLDDGDVGVPSPPVSAAEAAAPPTPTWTIEPGHHLWKVAEDTLARAWGRAPTDAEIVPFWRDVIELNRTRLVDRDNPDLVLAGQVMALPQVPSPPAAAS